ncbi:MAG: SGNH/GDSL hydrolase family protein [Lentisphaeria bacterium]|nr:SGNH/GDSL hydrolase family protein [Lentisphaeria bacterium]
MEKMAFSDVLERFERQDHVRIVALGASNTERHMPVIHWTDVLEIGLRARFGRKFQMINAGVSGNNTREALARFERDVAFYQPDIVIITLGGNDCNIIPSKFVPEDEFVSNLREIARRLRELGAVVIFQTYYTMITDLMVPQRAAMFVRYMKAVRQMAIEDGEHLIDQYALFDKIDRNYRIFNLMRDPMHTNENGNILIGLHAARFFDVDFETIPWREKLMPMQALLTKLLG